MDETTGILSQQIEISQDILSTLDDIKDLLTPDELDHVEVTDVTIDDINQQLLFTNKILIGGIFFVGLLTGIILFEVLWKRIKF